MRDQIKLIMKDKSSVKLHKRLLEPYRGYLDTISANIEEAVYTIMNEEYNSVCLECGKETIFNNYKKGYKNYCNKQCQGKHNADKIPTFIIGHISNLEMLPARENITKNKKCSITLDKLLREFYE